MKKYRLYFTAGMLAACMASAAIPKLLTADAPHLFVSAADQEISESMTLQADMTVDGNLTLSGGTLQLNGHTLTVKGDFWHKAGTISVSDGSTLIIKKNYEMRAGYATAGSGELRMVGADGDVNFIDVDGSMFVNSTVTSSSWQKNGTLQIGGDLTVLAPKASESSPMGNGLEMREGTVVTFKGDVQHEVNFQTNDDSYIDNIAMTGEGSLHLTGQMPGFKLASDVKLADGSVITGKRALELNGHTLNVDGSFSQDGILTVDLTNSKMNVSGDYWHKAGILNLDNSTLHIGSNYELRAGYAAAGSGELRMVGEPASSVNLMDVDGYVFINSTVINSSWQKNGTLQIGGDLTVHAPKASESSPMGNGLEMQEGTVVTFKGDVQHEVNFQTNDDSYIDNIAMTGDGSLHLTGQMPGFKLASDVKLADGSIITGKRPLELNGYTLTVDGSFSQDGILTVDLTNSKMNVSGDYWHKAGILNLDNSTLHIGKNYELRAGYATAGSGELSMVGESESSVNLMDVDGHVFINSTVINSSWQRNGTLQIGGDLTVYAPKASETSPMGNGLEMQEGTVVTFKGKVQHEVNFQTYGDSYITNVAVKDNGSLHLTGQTSGFTLVSDAFFADGSTLHGTTPLRLNGHTVYVNGSFAQDGDTTLDLTNSKMIVLSDYWHKTGILQLENSSLTIGGSYEMRAGYAAAGSGELRLTGEPENGTSIMDVHGDAIFNSKVSNSNWQRNGTLAIGGDLSVLSVDGGKSFTMLDGTTVKFYGTKKHSINFTDNNAYTGAIMIGVGDSISFAGYLNGVNRGASSTITVDPAALATVSNAAFSVTGASAGTGTIAFADEDKTVTKKFIVAAAEKITDVVMPEGIPTGNDPTVDPPDKKTRSAFEKISGLELDEKEGNLHEDDYHVLGWTRDGDWARYSNLDFEDGAYFFTLNGISVHTESSIELHLDGLEGKLIGTCNLDTAGGYGHYIDYTIPVEVTKGVHDLYLVFRREGGGECSQVNYFYFSRENKTTPPPEQTTRSAFDQIYYHENDGIEYLKDPNYPDVAQWLLFRNLDFEDGAYFFNMNGGNNKSMMRFELHLDSPDGLCIGSFDASTNEKGKTTDYTFPIEVTTGVHDLYLIAYPLGDELYEGHNGHFTLNYIYFSRKETTPNPGSDPQASMRGDVNSDGSIDLKDVIVLRRYLAGGWNVTINEANSDVNSDGSIDLKDVIILRRYLAGGWDIVL